MLERLQRLEANVRELQRFRQTYAEEEVRREPHLEWALRYRLDDFRRFAEQIRGHLR